ncbi:MAG TPA: response regulator [Steroidobacteraceae bacterium]
MEPFGRGTVGSQLGGFRHSNLEKVPGSGTIEASVELGSKGRVVSVSAVSNAGALVVLLVEDELLVRCDIATCMRDAGYVVLEAASGEEAIDFCNSGTSIDIVFTDINLSGVASGWDVAQHFRLAQPDVSVLYTSGKSIEHQRCVPGSVFVPKPYRNTDILKAVERLCPA